MQGPGGYYYHVGHEYRGLLYKGLQRGLSDHVKCYRLFVPGARATVHCIALILLVLSLLALRFKRTDHKEIMGA